MAGMSLEKDLEMSIFDRSVRRKDYKYYSLNSERSMSSFINNGDKS